MYTIANWFIRNEAKYVIQTVNNSTLGKLENCKLDKEMQQNFFPTLNHNQMIM